MKRSIVVTCLLAGFAVAGLARTAIAAGPNPDFGAFVAEALRAHAPQLFGFNHPLEESALGPYNGPDSTQMLAVADGLHVSLVSSAVHNSTDQIAMWPDDQNPQYLIVCDESSSNPAVQRVNLSAPPNSNATTIVTGLLSCDPVRRTPWGTILVGEEAGASGGLYEIFDPVNIVSPIAVTDRTAGTTSDPSHLVKRKAVGSLSWEGLAVRQDGTMIYADELAPTSGNAGGGVYKFVPTSPYLGGGPISMLSLSPFASGTVYGLRVAASGSSNWGQGAEIGKGRWTLIDTTIPGVVDGNGNLILRTAQLTQKFTGYYRPEDMDVDPIAAGAGMFRACWTNTGRMSHGGGSLVENSAVYSEVMCLVEEPPSAAQPLPPTGTIPTVTRFWDGGPQANFFDNVAFQPHTGNLVVLEDGETDIVTPTGTEVRGNDLWICLPDGSDNDTLTDGCVRFASLRDGTSEPTGFIFLGSGEEAFVSMQHRSADQTNNRGSLLRISGFKVR